MRVNRGELTGQKVEVADLHLGNIAWCERYIEQQLVAILPGFRHGRTAEYNHGGKDGGHFLWVYHGRFFQH